MYRLVCVPSLIPPGKDPPPPKSPPVAGYGQAGGGADRPDIRPHHMMLKLIHLTFLDDA